MVPDAEPKAEELISRTQSARHLRDAVDALPVEQSQVLRKNFFEDKPHSVIAEELDIPLGTVKSRVRLALVKLRQALQEME
jgi:RNA polymerase sigma-70 factor, ECF subfamily